MLGNMLFKIVCYNANTVLSLQQKCLYFIICSMGYLTFYFIVLFEMLFQTFTCFSQWDQTTEITKQI